MKVQTKKEGSIMTVCFTGHRNMNPENIFYALNALEENIKKYAESNREVIFRAGGAIGFDMLCALAVISAKDEHKNIKLHLILPCKDQTRGWSDANIQKYNYILSNADNVRYVSDAYTKYCMFDRNRALVDGSDICMAYYDGLERGGTAYTVRYANSQGVEVCNVYK